MVIFYPFRLFKKIFNNNNCFFRHDWGKWSQHTEVWCSRGNDYERHVQYRYCKKCNKLEKDYIN